MRLDCSELLCNRVLLKFKEMEKASDKIILYYVKATIYSGFITVLNIFLPPFRRGQKEYPLASVSNGVIYSPMNPKNVWRL